MIRLAPTFDKRPFTNYPRTAGGNGAGVADSEGFGNVASLGGPSLADLGNIGPPIRLRP